MVAEVGRSGWGLQAGVEFGMGKWDEGGKVSAPKRPTAIFIFKPNTQNISQRQKLTP